MAIRPTMKPLIEPITNRDEAVAVVAHLHEVMDALLKIVEQETALVRERPPDRHGTKLEPAKARLAQLYVADVARLKASSSLPRNAAAKTADRAQTAACRVPRQSADQPHGARDCARRGGRHRPRRLRGDNAEGPAAGLWRHRTQHRRSAAPVPADCGEPRALTEAPSAFTGPYSPPTPAGASARR